MLVTLLFKLKTSSFLQVSLENLLFSPAVSSAELPCEGASYSVYQSGVSLAHLLGAGVEALGLFGDAGILRSQPAGGVS